MTAPVSANIRNIAIIATPYQQAEQKQILDRLAQGEHFHEAQPPRRLDMRRSDESCSNDSGFDRFHLFGGTV